MILLLWILWCEFVASGQNRGLIVIPGLGRSDRLQTVVSNLNSLRADIRSNDSIMWDCIVYIYAPRSDESFWSMKEDIDIVRSLCAIVENPNKLVTENLYMVQPALIRDKYQLLFILLDDCLIKNEQFSLKTMVNVLRRERLSIASPLITGANKGGGQKFRNIMQTPPQRGSIGYISSFVEIFAWVMTFEAYETLWELLCPQVNPYAWGYDFWYDGYAKTKAYSHKMGIISNMSIKHEQNVEDGNGRTDNTKFSDKWNSVLAQERHYKKHLGINLTKFRNGIDLANTSWNGAVKALIYPT